ncbi:MAG: uroporphyrinogen-III synthase [Pyrinomonadaceae bacterium]
MPAFDSGKTYGLFDASANKKLIGEIASAGAEILLFPRLETSAVDLEAEARESLQNVLTFDWIIVPDVFAAEYFLLALEKIGFDFFELDAVRVCAFGESVSDRLRYSQVHADVITNTRDAAEAAAAIKNYEPDFALLKVLVLRSESIEPEIVSSLSADNINFTELIVYQTNIKPDTPLAKLKSLLKGGAVDEFIFSNPSEIAEFAILFYPEKPSGLLTDSIASAPDYSTLQSLRENNINKIIIR